MPGIPFPTDPNNRYKRGYGQPQGGATGFTGIPGPRMSRRQKMNKIAMLPPEERTGESVDMGLVSPQEVQANNPFAQLQELPPRRRMSRRGY
jgi:hypothetical protein